MVTLERNQGLQVWKGSFTVASEHADSADFQNIGVKLLSKTDSIFISEKSGVPSTLPVVSGYAWFERGSVGYITADISATSWATKFSSLDLKFTRLEGILFTSIEKDPKEWYCKVMGQTLFGPFVSAQACLEICKSRKFMLTGLLSKVKAGTSLQVADDAGDLVKALVSKPTYKCWRKIPPEDSPQLSLDAYTAMFLSFETSSLLFTGFISGLGAAVVLGRERRIGNASTAPKYDFMIALDIPNLSTLRTKLGPQVGDLFNLVSITAFFSSTDWTETDLKRISDDANGAKPNVLALSLFNVDNKFDKTKLATQIDTATKLIRVPPGATKLAAGAEFCAVVSLDGGKAMSDALNKASEPGTRPTIILSARVNQAETLFKVNISHFTFFGGAITLKNCEGKFLPNKKRKIDDKEGVNTLSFESELEFHIPDTEVLLGLKVASEITPQQAGFTVALANANRKQVAIPGVFGTPFGLTLDVLEFSGIVVFKKSVNSTSATTPTSTYKLEGKVSIDDVSLDARLLFYEGKPKVLTITISTSLSVEKIIGIVARGTNDARYKWPKESCPPISLDNGVIYYGFLTDNEPALIDPNDPQIMYSKGFNVQTDISLFSYQARAAAQLFLDRSGVKITGALKEEIDLRWLRLSRKDDTGNIYGNGPEFFYVWNNSPNGKDRHGIGKTRFEMNCNASIFNSRYFTCTIAYLAKDQKRDGMLYQSDAPSQIAKPGSKVNIVYQAGRFYVNGLDIMKAWNDLKLAAALMDVSKTNDKNRCGKLVDLLFDQMLKFKFSINLNFDLADDGKSPGLEAAMTIKLRIMLGNTDISLDEIVLPEWKGQMKFDPDLEAFFDWLLETVQSYLENIADWLLDHPEQLIKLLSWMNARNWGKELIKVLICRDLNPENVKVRHRELFPELYQPSQPDLSPSQPVAPTLPVPFLLIPSPVRWPSWMRKY